jgi:hypothetical protein
VSTIKITELPTLSSPAVGDYLVIVDDPSGTPITKKTTVQDVIALAVTASGSSSELSISKMVRAQQRQGVYSGCVVTEDNTGAGLDVDITAGHICWNGRGKLVTAGEVTLAAAHATLDRIDLICIEDDGTKIKVDGTAAAEPVAPSIPADAVVIASVYRTALDDTIVNADITDQRVIGYWPQTIVCAADESVANDTLQDDDELFFTIGASEVWVLDGAVQFTTGASSTPDSKVNWTFPSGATFSVTVDGYTVLATAADDLIRGATNQESTPSSTFPRGIIASAVCTHLIKATLINSTTPGTLQFRFAQNTTTGGTPLVRETGSSMILYRVS